MNDLFDHLYQPKGKKSSVWEFSPEETKDFFKNVKKEEAKMKKFGVLIYRKDKEAEYKKIFDDCYKKIKEAGGTKDGKHQWPSSLEDGIFLVQITPDAFRSYVHLKNFLSLLAGKLNDGMYDIGVVWGHKDSDSFLWTVNEFNEKDRPYWHEYMVKEAVDLQVRKIKEVLQDEKKVE